MTTKTKALIMKAKALLEAEKTLKRLAKEGEEYADKRKRARESND